MSKLMKIELLVEIQDGEPEKVIKPLVQNISCTFGSIYTENGDEWVGDASLEGFSYTQLMDPREL